MPGKSKKGGGLTVKKSALYKKQKFGEAKSPFVMKGHSPLNQNKETPKDLVEVFSLIPGSKYVKKAFRSAKEKIHKSKFAQKHLIVDPNKNELSKVGKFIKRHIE